MSRSCWSTLLLQSLFSSTFLDSWSSQYLNDVEKAITVSWKDTHPSNHQSRIWKNSIHWSALVPPLNWKINNGFNVSFSFSTLCVDKFFLKNVINVNSALYMRMSSEWHVPHSHNPASQHRGFNFSVCLAPVEENIAESAGLARSRNNVVFICRAWEEGPEHFGESLVKTETEQAV